MTALVADRNTQVRDGTRFVRSVAAGAKIFAGALVVLNAAKFAKPGSTATGLVADGRAEHFVDNSTGADGAVRIEVRPGVFPFANSASTDAIAQVDIGNACYIVDDQTVAKTDGSGTRSKAGTIVDIDAFGVWVGVGLLTPHS